MQTPRFMLMDNDGKEARQASNGTLMHQNNSSEAVWFLRGNTTALMLLSAICFSSIHLFFFSADEEWRRTKDRRVFLESMIPLPQNMEPSAKTSQTPTTLTCLSTIFPPRSCKRS